MVRLICDLMSVKSNPAGMIGPTGATYHFHRESGEADVHDIDADRFLQFDGFRRADAPPPPPPAPKADPSSLPSGDSDFDPDASPEERLATRRSELESATKAQLIELAAKELRLELDNSVKKADIVEAIIDAEFPPTPAD